MFSFIISLAYAMPQILLHILDVRSEHFQMIHSICENSVQQIVNIRPFTIYKNNICYLVAKLLYLEEIDYKYNTRKTVSDIWPCMLSYKYMEETITYIAYHRSSKVKMAQY